MDRPNCCDPLSPINTQHNIYLNLELSDVCKNVDKLIQIKISILCLIIDIKKVIYYVLHSIYALFVLLFSLFMVKGDLPPRPIFWLPFPNRMELTKMIW